MLFSKKYNINDEHSIIYNGNTWENDSKTIKLYIDNILNMLKLDYNSSTYFSNILLDYKNYTNEFPMISKNNHFVKLKAIK